MGGSQYSGGAGATQPSPVGFPACWPQNPCTPGALGLSDRGVGICPGSLCPTRVLTARATTEHPGVRAEDLGTALGPSRVPHGLNRREGHSSPCQNGSAPGFAGDEAQQRGQHTWGPIWDSPAHLWTSISKSRKGGGGRCMFTAHESDWTLGVQRPQLPPPTACPCPSARALDWIFLASQGHPPQRRAGHLLQRPSLVAQRGLVVLPAADLPVTLGSAYSPTPRLTGALRREGPGLETRTHL